MELPEVSSEQVLFGCSGSEVPVLPGQLCAQQEVRRAAGGAELRCCAGVGPPGQGRTRGA